MSDSKEDITTEALRKSGRKLGVAKPVAIEVSEPTPKIDLKAIEKLIQAFDFEESIELCQNLSMIALQSQLLAVVSCQAQEGYAGTLIKELNLLMTVADKLNALTLQINPSKAIKTLEAQGYVILRSPNLVKPLPEG
jgi:hypothetical protein